MQKLRTTLKELGLRESEIEVYLALTKLGEAKASTVAKKVLLSRTTVISILGRLEELGFVTGHKYKGVVSYWVESPNVLKLTLENKINVVDHLSFLLSNLYRSDTSIPSVKVFDTKASVRAFIEKEIASLNKGDLIRTIDSPNLGNYQKVFSDEYYFALLAQKKKNSIQTKTLIPAGSIQEIEPEKLSKQNITIREMPKTILFQASLWLMGDKLYLFSGTPPFIVMISQDMIVKSMDSLYEYLWNISS